MQLLYQRRVDAKNEVKKYEKLKEGVEQELKLRGLL
jgi:hypothetical protein